MKYLVVSHDAKSPTRIGTPFGYTHIQSARKIAYGYLKKNKNEGYLGVYIYGNGEIIGEAHYRYGEYSYTDLITSKTYPLYSSGRIGQY